MNSNLSCERYIGRLKLILEGRKVKDVDDLQIVDKRLRGYLARACDAKHEIIDNLSYY